MPGTRAQGEGKYRLLPDKPPTQQLRRVTVWDEKGSCEITFITDMLDVSAKVISSLDRKRWRVAPFFKWLKSYAGAKRLMSRNANKITLRFYVAVIETLLLYLTTKRKPDKFGLLWSGSALNGHALLSR